MNKDEKSFPVGIGNGRYSTVQNSLYVQFQRVFLIAISVMFILSSVDVQANEPGSTDGGVSKQPIPNGARGKSLAQRLCVNCHMVSSGDDKKTTDQVPTFHEIANRPKQTAQRIRQSILRPHYAMPTIALTMFEIDDIIAYLDELRTDATGSDLLPLNEQPDVLPVKEPS